MVDCLVAFPLGGGGRPLIKSCLCRDLNGGCWEDIDLNVLDSFTRAFLLDGANPLRDVTGVEVRSFLFFLLLLFLA